MVVSKYSYLSVMASDFWTAFEDNKELREVAESWAQTPGIPVIDVRLTATKITNSELTKLLEPIVRLKSATTGRIEF